MKKILFLLLCTVSIYGQTTTGQEQSFPYGILNESLQTITTPTYLTTTGMDGTQGKIPSALIAKTSDVADSLATKENIANKSDSYTTSSSTAYVSGKALVDGLGTKAPLSGSANYIQNQNAAPQTANMWISGSANFGTGISTTSLNGKEIQFYNVGVSPAILKVADDATSINSIELFKSGAVANVVVPNGTVTASNGTLIGGTLTSGYIPKATGANSLGNSLIYDNGTNVGIGTTSPSEKLEVAGTIKATSFNGSATLTGTPTAPTATAGTTGNQIATLDYVLADNANVVHKTGNESIAGEKTFFNTIKTLDINVSGASKINFGSAAYANSVSTAALSANRSIVLPDDSGTIALVETVRPYKVYTALLSQTGTNAPTATVLENTLGGTIVWGRSNAGFYTGTLTSAFPSGKTFYPPLSSTGPNENIRIYNYISNTSQIRVDTYFLSANSDGILNNNTIEIRVYN